MKHLPKVLKTNEAGNISAEMSEIPAGVAYCVDHVG